MERDMVGILLGIIILLSGFLISGLMIFINGVWGIGEGNIPMAILITLGLCGGLFIAWLGLMKLIKEKLGEKE